MVGGCWKDAIGSYGCTSCPAEQGGVHEGRGKDHDGPTATAALTTLPLRTSPWPAETSTTRPDVSGGARAVARCLSRRGSGHFNSAGERNGRCVADAR
jgi:hypothetical protein